MLYLFYYLLVHILVYRIAFCCPVLCFNFEMPYMVCTLLYICCHMLPICRWFMRHRTLSEQLVKRGNFYHFYTLNYFLSIIVVNHSVSYMQRSQLIEVFVTLNVRI